ncbi:DUF21 domain-containing protein, partial [Patescibacteria group bacterium]|nr:DUF21 domain-containing protein [Patescibacteria group bacterium]
MIEILIFAILFILSAFFASSETAIFSVSKFKLHALVKQNKSGAAVLSRLKGNPNRLLATILVGNNLVNILIASYATFLATEAFGSIGVGLATGGVTIVLLIIGETLPKSLAAHRPATVALFAAPLLEIFGYLIFPAVFILERISSIFTHIFAVTGKPAVTEEELKSVIAISKEAGV